MVDKNVEQKNIKNIEFTYNKQWNTFNSVKKLWVDMTSLIIIVILLILWWFTFYLKSTFSGLEEEKTIEYEETKIAYEDIKANVWKVRQIKLIDVNSKKFIDIFNYLNEYPEDYLIEYSKKKKKYYVEFSNQDINQLVEFVNKWIQSGLVDVRDTNETFMILTPNKANVIIYFKI